MNNFFLNVTTNIMSNFLLASRLQREIFKINPSPHHQEKNKFKELCKNKKSRKEETGVPL